MSTRIWLVVPAAGASRRVGGNIPKQYLDIDGRTVLEHSLRALLALPQVAGGVVVLAEGDTYWARLPQALRARFETATGGRERCHSVLAGLQALHAADEDWALVHDAARPCVAREELAGLVAACEKDDTGGLLALPLADTLKRAGKDGRVAATVPRESLWRAQTPQMFRYLPLRRALQAAIEAGLTPGDEATAMELAGHHPLLVEGSPYNIKVTQAADLGFAAAVLASRKEGAR